MTKHKSCVSAVLALLLASSLARGADNPLLAPSPLPYGAPPFDRIRDSDYAPAIAQAIADHQEEIGHIANQAAQPDFRNTIVSYEASGTELARVKGIFEQMVQAASDPVLDRARVSLEQQLQAHQDSIYLNPKLFARIDALYEARDQLKLDAPSLFLLERLHAAFVHEGAALAPASQARLRDINQRISALQAEYAQKALAAREAAAIVVDNKADLAGLDEAELAAALQAGKTHGHPGAYVLPLVNTTQQPVLAKLQNRALRLRIMQASETRGDADGPNDARMLIKRLAWLRAEKAHLFGYPTYAAYQLSEQMAKTPKAVEAFLRSMVPSATGAARQDTGKLQAIVDSQNGGFRPLPADWEFYERELRARDYALDEASLKPYFELHRVLQDGVFFAASRLYGVTLLPRHDLPVYDPDMLVFDVIDANGKKIALFYADYFARPNKQGGAWCADLIPPSRLTNQLPVVINTASFTKPAPGQPALISLENVTTMFHEFGHALHTIFSNQTYPDQNGFSVPVDVVEFPSQFNEHWALDPQVLAHYARHWQTGAPLPADMAEKIRHAKSFDQGYKLTENLTAAAIDLEWHSISAGALLPTVEMFETMARRKYGLNLADVPPRYRSTYFSHIWSGDYAASYYSYLWGEVLDDDAFEWFTEHGGLTRANGQHFRDAMLAPGYTADPMALYQAFRGRAPDNAALLRARGLPEKWEE